MLFAIFHASIAAADDLIKDRMELLAGSGSPVVIEADTAVYDRKTGAYTLTGDVKLSQGGRVLTADRAVLNTQTGEAHAEGRVTLTDPENSLSSDKMTVNFETGLGVIEKGRIFVKRENYHITGESIERLSETEFEVVDGSLTTCDGKTPFWRITASDLKVRMDKDVRAEGVVMRIKEVPVLYSPYAWFPLLKPRTTGLLIPSVGYSTDDGFKLYESFYWAPADNYDATFDLNYLSNRGAGLGVELRLALDTESYTRLYGFYMDDRKDKSERYNLELAHVQKLFDRVMVKANMNISDKQFFRDLAESTVDRTQRSIDSNFFVTYNQDDWGGYILTQYTRQLDINSEVAVQRLPEAGFRLPKKQLYDTPFYMDAEGSAAYFHKEEGVTGGRYDIFPKLTGVLPLGGVNLIPRVGYRETVYSLAGAGHSRFDEERGLFGSGVTLQSELSKLYGFDSGWITAMKHTLEPVIAYDYVATRGGRSFVKFDGLDTFGRRSIIAYSLTNRFVFKYPRVDGDGYDLSYLTMKLGQYYDQHADVAESGTNSHFSSIFGEAVYKTSYHLKMNADFRYNTHAGKLMSINTDVRYEDPRGGWHAVLGQRFSRDTSPPFMSPSRFDFFTPSTDFVSDFVVSGNDEDKQVYLLTAEAGVKLGTHWNLSGRAWYDLRTESFRETMVSAGYESQCWGISIGMMKRPRERQVLIMLDLKGLGAVRPRLI